MKSIDDPGITLPEGKRRELERVVALLREGFAEAVAERRAPRFRDGKLLKIILFGSYARGDWVEDPVGRYFSDYDILVVVDHEDLTDVPEFWLKTEDRLLAEVGEGKVRTPVSVIYHSLDDVNDKLKLGRYFFTDIVKDGIVLFEERGHPFETPRKLTPAEALKETQDYYDEWFESAIAFSKGAQYYISIDRPKEAAFQLHQATERYYHTLFLVRTLYSPKTHNLNRLRSQTEALEPRLREVWPGSTKFERRCYELLRAAYVKARYSRHYRITAEELDWIGGRVEVLRGLIEELCLKRLDELERAA
ncbi:HEPN domain-containing protein [Sphingosinicella microcystinivorans]|uniref:Nucleotidyltransferase n=1 Tax=Sphingosinicella microcystinivorans TaxID=335406 RepID=A0AAD1D5L7_SPHMI|nr:HEPN domain-containing protein [Sphingosinicella microcystinivorans]RKS85026.1 nucleotidyltransferase-like protein [Sphingosinicella microcystinivorans]BBE33316.1 nucleotidyltransferase [Sphingosinicella microcystinivorans]